MGIWERLRNRLRSAQPETDSKGEEGSPALSGRSETPARNLMKPKPTDLLFKMTHRELFKQALEEEELQFNREGRRRTAYSLKRTYPCLRLIEGADIYQIEKNCRTSVEMIDKIRLAHQAEPRRRHRRAQVEEGADPEEPAQKERAAGP